MNTATEQLLTNGSDIEVWNGISKPDTSHLITDDDEPVDNLLSEKQQRLLTEVLYTNTAWNKENRTFIASANVGIFAGLKSTPIVPDVFVSLDIPPDATLDLDYTRAYFAWVFEKMPDVVIEIVSNRKGGEMARKLREYARLHITHYAVFDPFYELKGEVFMLYTLQGGKYVPHRDFWMEGIGLGLRLWEGEYEGMSATWLRWCDDRGKILPTGKERTDNEILRADKEKRRAEKEKHRAEQETQRAEREKRRAEKAKQQAEHEKKRAVSAEERAQRLAEQLRALDITPEE